jgi:aromatic-L-amino-acid/L-tryptophan decarboxylase
LSDLPADASRAALHRAADMVADYLEHVGSYPVMPRIKPGDVRALLPATPPESGEPLDRLLDDYRRVIEPNVTHWNHPGFLAYFGITGSAPGILGELLTAGLNTQAMLWRTGPAPTELEEHVCDWLRQLMGLPAAFRGHINDTASMSTLLAMAAARHRARPDLLAEGMAGRPDLPTLTLYASAHAHSAIDKAAIALGIGVQNLRRIPVDDAFRMDAAALDAAVTADRRAGRLPIAVLATVGTTYTTSIDPVPEIARIARREGMWLHVDAAYAGSAAICPEYRALMSGVEEADSIVVNPHKWLFTPMDCSVLLLRDPDALRGAFALAPLAILYERDAGATNLSDYGPQLGRRFRSLKLWFVLRAYGAEGLRERIRTHCALAQQFAGWVRAEPGFEVAAPVPFSTVCFRAVPTGDGAAQDAFNERLLAEVNAAGPVLLSHTMLRERYVLRLAIGNIRTTEAHVAMAWRLVRETAARLRARG